MIEFKGLRESLTLRRVQPELIKILRLCAMWSNRSGHDIRITSLNDHDHSDTSLHYEDLAVDFQVLTASGRPNKRAMGALAKHLKQNLGYGYDVVWNSPGHYNHVHVEFDDNERPRKNAN
jgi:hypothetical protein